MTIEEKARRYDEALERAKNCLKDGTITQVAIDYIETIFPELAESEDERIRKSLINFIDNANKCGENPMYEYGIYPEEILAWLEKQGEKPQGKTALEAINEEIVDNANKVVVEPKFKVGDWINGYYTNYKVLSVNNKGYVVEDVYGNKINILFENEKFHHLWTIQDAKDGDVLACGDKITDCPFIFHNLTEELNPRSYCGVNTFGHFQDNDENGGHWCYSNEVRPATKEQRDLLFQKMKEAGYEWNEEKKELKKIEQKPTDKVAPKFKVGDWITNTNGEYTWCVEYVKLLDYGLIDKDGRSVYDDVSYVDSHFHLWTMRDAKDGNVLVDVYGNIGIIQEYDDFDWRSYCSLGCNGGFQGFNVEHENDKTHPATKEQRDLLFQKMKEAGYEWDAEKKELKKIEQKPYGHESKRVDDR